MLARCRFLFVTPLSALFPFTPIPPILHQFTKSCLLCFFTLCTTVSRGPFTTNKYSNIVRLPCCWFHLFFVIQGLSWDQIKFLKPPNSGRQVLSENLQRWLTHPKVHRFSVRTDFQLPHVTRPIADIVSFVKSVFVYICFSVPLLRTCTCLILNLLYESITSSLSLIFTHLISPILKLPSSPGYFSGTLSPFLWVQLVISHSSVIWPF